MTETMKDYRKYINALRKCAKEHENDRVFTGHIIVFDLCRDTASLLETMEKEHKWISVTEDVPPKGTVCLWCNKQGNVNQIEHWKEDANDIGCEVIAWQPLPEPYKED